MLAEHIEAGDEVMADKGFNILTWVLRHHGKGVWIPTKRQAGQAQLAPEEVVTSSSAFSSPPHCVAPQVERTARIANLRIEVEHAVRRIKSWRYFSSRISLLQMDVIHKVVAVVAGLCNIVQG